MQDSKAAEKTDKFFVTTALMGYGHLRAADNVVRYGRSELIRVDRAPYAGPVEQLAWGVTQSLYHCITRTVENRSHVFLSMLERLEEIPEESAQASLGSSRFVRTLAKCGVGRRFSSSSRLQEAPLLHTYFGPALFNVYHSHPGRNYLLLCDSDFHRVWVPLHPGDGNLRFLVPTAGGADRLKGYGVPTGSISVTGFPLPPGNIGGKDQAVLKTDYRSRWARLSGNDHQCFNLMFALSGAGCYFRLLRPLMKSLHPAFEEGRIRLQIALGNNRRVKSIVERWLRELRLEGADAVSLLYHPQILHAFEMFNHGLREADLLITKPGEIVFYAALGLPMILLQPIGKHEEKNRLYLLDNDAAVDFPGTDGFDGWLESRRKDGYWQSMAGSARERLPSQGNEAIHEVIQGG